jgi:hypothetical protein
MAYRKPYRKPAEKTLRFRVERSMDDKTFLVLDTLECKYYEFATRQEAETDCAKRNGALMPKTSERRELPAIRAKLRKGGVLSPAESAALYRARPRDLQPARPRHDPQVFIDQIRKELPALCRAWGSQMAHKSGIDEARRRTMSTDEVVDAVGFANAGGFFSHPPIDTVDAALGRLRWECLEDEGLQGVIAVNYLSREPARLKALYLRLSRTDYFRKLDEGHQYLARCLAAEYDEEFDEVLWLEIEDYSPADDECCGLNPGDLFGFTIEKW